MPASERVRALHDTLTAQIEALVAGEDGPASSPSPPVSTATELAEEGIRGVRVGCWKK